MSSVRKDQYDWIWKNGQPYQWTNWGPGEPNIDPSENPDLCVRVRNGRHKYQWYDRKCSQELHPYLCESMYCSDTSVVALYIYHTIQACIESREKTNSPNLVATLNITCACRTINLCKNRENVPSYLN